jgi:hypothetical protein
MPIIEFQDSHSIKIPESFVYLCNATRASNVNLTPIFFFGRGRVKAIIIQSGVISADNITPFEEQEAVLPAKRLRAVAKDVLGLPDEAICSIQASPERLSGWSASIQWAKQNYPGVPIVANLQGGTKEMAMGTMAALNDPASGDCIYVFIGKRSGLPRLVGKIKGLVEERETNIDEGKSWIPVKALGISRGYQMSRNEDEAAALVDYEWAEAIFQRMTNGNLELQRQALRGFNKAHSIVDNNDFDLNALNDRQRGRCTVADLGWWFCCDPAYPEYEEYWNNGNLGNRKDPVRLFLTGAWLEQLIERRVKNAFNNSLSIGVLANATLTIEGVEGSAAEIDLIVADRDTLHLIEVKTSVTTNQLAKQADQLGNKRSLIEGNLGRAWIVAPFLEAHAKQESLEGLKKRIHAKGVTLLYGNNAVDLLIAEISALRGGAA